MTVDLRSKKKSMTTKKTFKEQTYSSKGTNTCRRPGVRKEIDICEELKGHWAYWEKLGQGVEEIKKWHSRVRLALDRVSVVKDNVIASLRAISSFSLPMEPWFCMGGDASSSREWITIYLSQFWPMIYKGKSLEVFQIIKSHKWVELLSPLPSYFLDAVMFFLGVHS